MSDSLGGSFNELHDGAGTASGAIEHDGRLIPVVTLSFMVDRRAADDLNNGHYDPDDGRWANYSMTVRGARQLIADMNDAIDFAVRGARESSDE